jgi:hypothetical protein
MKNALFIPVFSLLLSLSCANNARVEMKHQHKLISSNLQTKTLVTKENSMLDEYWPFIETLKNEDPFVSELLAIN